MPALGADALRVLEARYLRRDRAGRATESPAELFARVARGVAQGELLAGTARAAARWEERFHELLAALDFLPNSPVLMNAGTPLGQLAACFVVPIGDSMEAIFDALRAMALVQRTGGGTGFSFSHLRPRGEVVASTGGTASGPVSFMRVFDAATEHIKQGGRRRGANMAVLRVDHPDVLEFVEAKRDGTSLQNFNLSVGVTDRFMEAVVADARYELVHPRRGTVTASLPAREVFDRIVEAAWATGDPGLVFLDAIERANPTPALGAIETTNPCGEVPLLPWESCVLGSVNLAHMTVTEGGTTTVDWRRLARTVRAAVRFLDDVIEVNREPLAEIGRATRRTRKIGVGVMGFAELLVRLGVSYAERAAVAWADRLSAFVAREARVASQKLAEERGVFPAWRESLHAARGERLRNATLLSVAPTGTISIVAGTSGGIEPLFALAYRRTHTLGGAPFAELNPVFRTWLESQGLDAAPLLAGVLAEGHLGRVPGAPAAARALFVTATELPPSQHLAVQAAVQRHVDNAVSKTVNLPEDARPDEVAATYLEAWPLGLKGVTVYRAGSRERQVLELGMGESAVGRELFARCDPDACRL
jgi:ribonucleoside-diphosphate reductase alpha chain